MLEQRRLRVRRQNQLGPIPRAPALRRRGAVLVNFALTVFVLLGIAALTIDLGMALLTRRQMQTAVDTAALEGLRYRDETPASSIVNQLLDAPLADATDRDAVLQAMKSEAVAANFPISCTDGDLDQNCPELRNYIRRKAASRMIALTFDDNLDLSSTNDHAPQLGAGPIVRFENGIAIGLDGFEASQTLVIPEGGSADPRTYLPRVPLNPTNLQKGNLVGGDYHSGLPHAETDDFERGDFTPSAGMSADSFLVRLARSSRPDDSSVSGSFEAGSALPWLFGRMSLIQGGSKGMELAVRATSIASAGTTGDVGRVMSVGAPVASVSPPLTGGSSVALLATVWEPAIWDSIPAAGDGSITLSLTGGNLTTTDINGLPVDAGFIIDATFRQIGDLPSHASNGTDVGPAATPIVVDAAGPIIAFGAIEVLASSPSSIQLRRFLNRISSENVSATLGSPFSNSLDITDLMTRHRSVTGPDPLGLPTVQVALTSRFISVALPQKGSRSSCPSNVMCCSSRPTRRCEVSFAPRRQRWQTNRRCCMWRMICGRGWRRRGTDSHNW